MPNINIKTVAYIGEDVLGETFLNNPLKKNALSLDITYTSLDPEVIATVPHANIDILTIIKNILPTIVPRFACKIYGSGLFDAIVAGRFLIAKVTAIRNAENIDRFV
jgi:hypothetical protein